MFPSEHIDTIEDSIGYIKGTLNQWRMVSRGDSALIILLLMMLAYVVSEGLKIPFEHNDHPEQSPSYGALLLGMITAAVLVDYVSSRNIRAILKTIDRLDIHDELISAHSIDDDVRLALTWIDEQEPAKHAIDKYLRPALCVSSAVTSYAVAGQPGVALAGLIMFSIKLNELNQQNNIRPKPKIS